MKVLHITPAYYPATYWGGPTFSTYALCNEIAHYNDISIRVLSTDTAGPTRRERVKVTGFPMVYPPGYEVFFTHRCVGKDIAPGLLRHLRPFIRWADVVHLTATYSFPTIPTMIICRILNKPMVWSPRGALQAVEHWPGARRRLAKRVFDALCRRLAPTRSVVHVTAEMERVACVERMPQLNTVTIPNGIDVPEILPQRVWRPNGRLRLLYISRLDPKKGIEILFGTLILLPKNVTLDIYGTGAAAYLSKLKTLAAALGIADRIVFHGHVEGEAKARAFAAADLFVLSSFSENFGIVIAEALAHGVPVIVSHATPWPEIERVGCGRWIENTSERFAAAVADMADQDLEAAGCRGRDWMRAEFGWQKLADRMVETYRSLVAEPKRTAK